MKLILYRFSVEVELPEGRLSSLIVTLDVGMGIEIENCTIEHLQLTSVQTDSVVISNTAVQVDLGAVYNRPDNL